MKIAVIFVLAGLLTGCVAPGKYAWGEYDRALYNYYKRPGEAEAFSKALQDTIQTAEANAQRVPPGIYAEYGFALLQQGKKDEAIRLFEQEKKVWPESTRLMDLMIAQTGNSKAKQSSPSESK